MRDHPRAYNSLLSGEVFAIRARNPRADGSAGFTLVELVSVLVLIGILGAIFATRIDSGLTAFHQRFMYDETVTALRYARNRAITKQCNFAVRLGTTVSRARRLGADDGVVVVTVVLEPDGVGSSPACLNLDLDRMRSVVPRPGSRQSEWRGIKLRSPFFIANENGVSLPSAIVAFDPLGRPYNGSGVLSQDIALCVGVRPIIIRHNSGLIDTPVGPRCAQPPPAS